MKLNELGDIVAAVPYLLGFQPEESLVAVALQGPRQRLSFALRLDLAAVECIDDVVAMLSERMTRAAAQSVMLFVYTATGPGADAELPRAGLAEELLRRLPMPVRDVVLVSGGRVWSYLCAEPECCPPGGRLLDASAPGTLALAAAHALHGNAVLPDRDAVVASVAPLGGVAAVSLDQALERAATTYAAIGREDYRRAAQAVAADVLRRYREPPATMSDDEAAQLVIGLHDVVLRDELIGWAHADEDALRLLAFDLARRALPPMDPPACTLLAWMAYLHGDGLVAASALDRALASDADYRLAQLLSSALHGQVAPEELRRIMAAGWPKRGASRESGRRRG
ncbi:MAG: hypothetical protein QOJ03_2029 [Frankiaceae bacterium]|nr:hypothetical protein [Frankiaceae bacterium]